MSNKVITEISDRMDAWLKECFRLYYDKNFESNENFFKELKEKSKNKEFELVEHDDGYDFKKNDKVVAKFKVNVKENFNKKEILKESK